MPTARLSTSKVKFMENTFDGALSFNQELVWDTSRVTLMTEIFHAPAPPDVEGEEEEEAEDWMRFNTKLD